MGVSFFSGLLMPIWVVFDLPSDIFNLKMQLKFLHVNPIFLLAANIIIKWKWKSCIKFGLPVITADKFLCMPI